MIDSNEWLLFQQRFPHLLEGTSAASLLREHAVSRRVNDGDVLYRDGDECAYLPLVVSGELLLTKYGETGRAIHLYRVENGQSCILSTLSILNGELFPAEATSRGASTLALIPATMVRRLVEEEGRWREFVFATYHRRLSGLIALIQEVVFEKLDVRLADHLLNRINGGDGTLKATHQSIAEELGSSREVVSRLLKEWERHGYVSLQRGTITVVDPQSVAKKFHHRD